MGKKSNNSKGKSGSSRKGGSGKGGTDAGGSNKRAGTKQSDGKKGAESSPMWRRWDVIGFAVVALVVGSVMHYYRTSTSQSTTIEDSTNTGNDDTELLLDARKNPLLSSLEEEEEGEDAEFVLSSNERWMQIGSAIVGPHNRSLFGDSLVWMPGRLDNLDHLTLVIGAPLAFNLSGLVQIFTLGGPKEDQKDWTNLANFSLDVDDPVDDGDEAIQFGKSLVTITSGDDSPSLWIGAHAFREATGIVQTYTKETRRHDGDDDGDESSDSWKKSGKDWIGDDSVHGHGFCMAATSAPSSSSSGDDVVIAVASPGFSKGRGRVQTRLKRGSSIADNRWQSLPPLEGNVRSENFGTTLALNTQGTVLAVGSPMYSILNDTAMVEQCGMTRIYKRRAAAEEEEGDDGSWKQVAEFPGTTAKGWSGQSVSLNHDGKRIAIGVPGYDEGRFPTEGMVRVFEQHLSDDGSSSWDQLGQDIVSGSSSQFGYKVELSKDGNLLVVSAIYKSSGDDMKRAGGVQLFRYYIDELSTSGSGSWKRIGQELKGKQRGDWFGASIALLEGKDRLRLAVGANGRNNGGHGYVKVFELGQDQHH